MKNLIILLVGLSLCTVACRSADSADPLTNEDYAIYSTYLESFLFYRNTPSAETIILEDSTKSITNEIHPETTWLWIVSNLGERCKYLKDTAACHKAKHPAWASLFENVKQSARHRQDFLQPSKFKVRYPIQLLSQFRKQLPKVRRDNDSLTYYIFGLSRVAYNIDKTKALFFGSFICGSTCGRGELIMLEKVDDTWVLIDRFRFWIA
ncbi:hypothetical protein [Spirosoma litoris]